MATLSSRLAPLTVSVPAASEWVSFTPVWSGWTTNVTHTGFWRRVGDSIEMLMHSTFSGVNTQGPCGTLTLPNNLSIDTAKLPTTTTAEKDYAVGIWQGLDSGVLGTFVGTVYYRQDLNTIVLAYPTGSTSSTSVDTSVNRPFTISSGDTFSIRVTLPISGWTSHTASATSANALVVGGQSVGSTLSFGATSNHGFNILANNTAAIASTAAGALTLGLPSAIGGSTYAGQAIVGRTNGSAISAGYVGEHVYSRGTGTHGASGTTSGITTVSITSGMWIVFASMTIDPIASVAAASIVLSDSTATGNSISPGYALSNVAGVTDKGFSAPSSTGGSSGVIQIFYMTSSSKTIYLNAYLSYSGGAPTRYGHITAIRIA